MWRLYSDEAWELDQWIKSIAAVILQEQDAQELSSLLDQQSQKYEIKEFKFARVRTNAGVVEATNAMMSVFFELFAQTDGKICVISGAGSIWVVHEMYDEIFLISQSGSGDEGIQLLPDTNNALKRYEQTARFGEYGIVWVQEQDSQEQLLIQMMDLISGITVWLREHHETYWAWTQISDRHQQMEEFDRDVHFRCELVDHFVGLIQEYIGELSVTDTGLWVVESERAVVLEY